MKITVREALHTPKPLVSSEFRRSIPQEKHLDLFKLLDRTSLVVQLLRICLPMQGTQG